MYSWVGHSVGIKMAIRFLAAKIGKMQLPFTEMGVTSVGQDVGMEAVGLRA